MGLEINVNTVGQMIVLYWVSSRGLKVLQCVLGGVTEYNQAFSFIRELTAASRVVYCGIDSLRVETPCWRDGVQILVLSEKSYCLVLSCYCLVIRQIG